MEFNYQVYFVSDFQKLNKAEDLAQLHDTLETRKVRGCTQVGWIILGITGYLFGEALSTIAGDSAYNGYSNLIIGWDIMVWGDDCLDKGTNKILNCAQNALKNQDFLDYTEQHQIKLNTNNLFRTLKEYNHFTKKGL